MMACFVSVKSLPDSDELKWANADRIKRGEAVLGFRNWSSYAGIDDLYLYFPSDWMWIERAIKGIHCIPVMIAPVYTKDWEQRCETPYGFICKKSTYNKLKGHKGNKIKYID